jgi:hypothetical protein
MLCQVPAHGSLLGKGTSLTRWFVGPLTRESFTRIRRMRFKHERRAPFNATQDRRSWRLFLFGLSKAPALPACAFHIHPVTPGGLVLMDLDGLLCIEPSEPGGGSAKANAVDQRTADRVDPRRRPEFFHGFGKKNLHCVARRLRMGVVYRRFTHIECFQGFLSRRQKD